MGYFKVLLVEDTAAEAGLFRQALQEACPTAQIHWVQTGKEAVEFTRLANPSGKPGPISLIVLDLNMPGLSGLETLRLLKSNPRSKGTSCCDVF